MKQSIVKTVFNKFKKNKQADSILNDEYTRIINYRHYLREIEHENISYAPVNIYRILKQSKNKCFL